MSWKVPRIWVGGECWILGGGPSLPREFGVPEEVINDVLHKRLPLSAYSPYMAAIHDKHVIGVNMAYKIGDWIDMVFFGDKDWYLKNREDLAAFRGLKVTCHEFFDKPQFINDENVKLVTKDKMHPSGISPNLNMASWNYNSGAAAVSVAVHMGATRIILVGFDMQCGPNGKQHWHGEYGTFKRKPKEDGTPFKKHLPGFDQMAKDAHARGIQIINACPVSTIRVFPKQSVKEALNNVPVKKAMMPVKRVVDGFKVMKPTEPGKRFMWLSQVINHRRYKIGAEIGCSKGNTTKFILRHNKHLILYAVDLWRPVPKSAGGGRQYKSLNFAKIRADFDSGMRPFNKRVRVLQGISWEMADKVEDNSLDFIFIDADHEYASVVKDIAAWTPKLKPGGMISGHDTHFEEVHKVISEFIPTFKAIGIDHCWEAAKEDVKLDKINKKRAELTNHNRVTT